jgi:hypothetical protein
MDPRVTKRPMRAERSSRAGITMESLFNAFMVPPYTGRAAEDKGAGER